MPNKLAYETSPYLLQHADNPVDWYPWSEEALNKAREENKPIMLSIGYSACHWCHVMAQESFADPKTAQLLNQLFINIKVDREERPDLDKIYQTAHQLLTQQSGGWPLTTFLNPHDQTPFFSGTYFPPEPRYGILSFKEVAQRVADIFHSQFAAITEQNQRLREVLQQLAQHKNTSTDTLNSIPLTIATEQLVETFDAIDGGFYGAPKFPHPNNLERLLCYWYSTHDVKALNMTTFSLEKMALGGIYDQIGGGFYRYSVDAQWQIPHFEKMLYDNGQLLSVYAEAFAATQNSLFAHIVNESATWAIREMQAPEGGYYASLDADSEHHEGKFYYWDKDEIKRLLSSEEYKIATMYYGLNESPNFEGHWHLHVNQSLASLSTTVKNAAPLLHLVQQKLLEARRKKIRPHRDEKILTAWNALMIKGIAMAGKHLKNPDFIASASRALDFIWQKMWKNQRLLASYKDGHAHLPAYLDDYAFLIDAILTLLEVRWRDDDLNFAIALADTLLLHFEDQQNGGFFFTANDHETLIQKPKPLMDEAIPAGNAIACYVLNRLGHLLGETRYLQAAERTLKYSWSAIVQLPSAYNTLLNALEEYLSPPEIIILRGAQNEMTTWQTLCSTGFNPHRLTFAIPNTVTQLPGILSNTTAKSPHVTAYFCKEHQCSAPIENLSEFQKTLST